MAGESPVLTPDHIKALLTEGGMDINELLLKLTPQEKKAALPMILNTPEFVEKIQRMDAPMGPPFGAFGRISTTIRSGAGKKGLGRIPRDGGIVKGSGDPKVSASLEHAQPPKSNLHRESPLSSMDEADKRKVMFGGMNAQGSSFMKGGKALTREQIQQLIQNALRSGK